MSSELQRHVDANEVEEKRHAEAGEIEMATHAENTRSYEELHAEVEVFTQKAKKETARRDFAVIVLVILALTMMGLLAGYTLISRNDESRSNGHRIDELTVKLDEARLLLVEVTEDDKSILECQARFDTLLRSASFEPLASIGDLVVIISTVVPGPEREAAVTDSIIELGNRVEETRQAIARLAEWNNDPTKLPCPI